MPGIEIIRANGIDIAYETTGDPGGAPLVMIAGFGMEMGGWDEGFCELLAGCGFFVIRFDNRDVGLSGKSGGAYSLEDMADDTAGLLDALDIEAAHILGMSMGGMIAQLFAANYPFRTLGLVQVMTSSGERSLPGTRKEAIEAIMTRPPEGRDLYVDHLVRVWQVLGADKPVDESILRKRAMRCRGAFLPGVLRQFAAIRKSTGRENLLKAISAPTLVVHGDADPVFPIEHGRRLAELIPGASLLEIPDMGHDLHPDTWVDVAVALRKLADR